MAAPGYEANAERLFNDLPVDGFSLEYDTPRAGDFAPLRLVLARKFMRLNAASPALRAVVG